ncbi:hypothetical protein OAO79_03955 [Flavobacteriaceae bacterium]|nr:hypothetical protein [Flavobacteriaceae bacterium]
MKKLLLIIMVLPFLGTGILNAQKLSKNDVFDILIKWEGKWKNSAVFEKSAWTKERNETRGTTETNLILLNNYLEIMVYNEDNISKHIISYDQMSSQFNRWEFKSDGSNTFWTGKWNKADKSMTWNYIDFSNYGINGKIIENFNSDGMIRTRTVMKDKAGKSLLKINSTKEKI